MKNFGPLQTISVFGIIFSAASQLILWLIDKHIDNIWMLYPTWICIFIIGWLIKKFYKGESHHHH